MSNTFFDSRLGDLFKNYNLLVNRKNKIINETNGIFNRYKYPVLTAEHTPLFWRYDFDYKTNPLLQERLGINGVFNPGAIELEGKIYLVARVEGVDRKSFFAIAESPNGVDQFRFWDYPILLPEMENPDVNVYDMRLVKHEDGWIYGLFCTERKDTTVGKSDTSTAIAQCGIVRTKDLLHWERLNDLQTRSPQQRNVVLHPEFVNKHYAIYTRPQDGFIEAGSGGGIGWGLTRDIEHAMVDEEIIVNDREYHTIKESKNGLGPAPIKTKEGWLHLAHGVRNTAAGLRYVLYLFMTSIDEPFKMLNEPAGYFLAPVDEERVGDVSNVVFSNGWVCRQNGEILIYYASSDTRCHVASTTVDKLLDYLRNTPADPLRTGKCVKQRIELIDRNMNIRKTWSIYQ